MAPTLPPGAKEFFAVHGRAASAIGHRFHAWLAHQHLAVAKTMPDDVWWFISIKGRPPREHYASVGEASRRRQQLLPYLQWLWRGHWLCFDPEVLRSAPPPPPPDRDPYSGSTTDPHFLWCTQDWRALLRHQPARRHFNRSRASLPHTAKRFLGTLAATLKPSTIRGYASTLGRLYAVLQKQNLALTDLSRRHVEDWCRVLHAEGLHPSTRLDLLQQTRTYLRWAFDEGLVTADPGDLIRRADFPKLPQYLPRPLPPDVDRALQARLAAGGFKQRALLLMRRTGLRIGELLRLEHQCLRTDPKGRLYLKVPLGKLDTERLVPLDEETVALVRRLQGEGARRAFLLAGEAGKEAAYNAYRLALADASIGLVVAEPITSHRLRHTFATSMLAGGMSLPALMRILGHRDHRMTLRYAAITDELVVKEYHDALAKLSQRYDVVRVKAASAKEAEGDPATLLTDVARWVRSRSTDPRVRSSWAKHIRRLIQALRNLEPPPKP